MSMPVDQLYQIMKDTSQIKADISALQSEMIQAQGDRKELHESAKELREIVRELSVNIPAVYTTKSDILLVVNSHDLRLKVLEEHNRVGTQWANDEHARIQKELSGELKSLRDDMNRGFKDAAQEKTAKSNESNAWLIRFIVQSGVSTGAALMIAYLAHLWFH